MDIAAQRYEIEQTKKHLAALEENIQDWKGKLESDLKKLAELEAEQGVEPLITPI